MILLLNSCQVTSGVTEFDNLNHFDIKELKCYIKFRKKLYKIA
jgi:hypothetical protein